MNRSIIIILILAGVFAIVQPSQAGSAPRLYAIAIHPAPVLDTPDFASVFGGSDGRTLSLDPSGLVRQVEFVALPGTVFLVEETIVQGPRTIYRVTTDDYPYPTDTGYFIDSRFVRTTEDPPPPRPRPLPSKQQVIENLIAAEGSRYVWGGNIRAGIPQLLDFYPPSTGAALSHAAKEMWQLRGVDCSGLLYEATGGFTPRNTSSLVGYGEPVKIAGLDADGITGRLEPLDLIVWSGHVMIVLDRKRLIESRLGSGGKGGGVVVRPLRESLEEVMKERVPLYEYQAFAPNGKKGFVIRRWYPAGD